MDDTRRLEPLAEADGLGGVPEHVDPKTTEQREGVLTEGEWMTRRDPSPLAKAEGLGGVYVCTGAWGVHRHTVH